MANNYLRLEITAVETGMPFAQSFARNAIGDTTLANWEFRATMFEPNSSGRPFVPYSVQFQLDYGAPIQILTGVNHQEASKALNRLKSMAYRDGWRLTSEGSPYWFSCKFEGGDEVLQALRSKKKDSSVSYGAAGGTTAGCLIILLIVVGLIIAFIATRSSNTQDSSSGYRCQSAVDAYSRGDYSWFSSDITHTITGAESTTFNIGHNDCVMVVPNGNVRVMLNTENDTHSAPYSFPAARGGVMTVSNVDQSPGSTSSMRILQKESSENLTR